MTINDIYLFVKDQAGEADSAYVLRRLTDITRRLWLETDMPGTLLEMTVQPGAERIMILPWYVYQLKGVRRATNSEVTLYQPQAAYIANGTHQFTSQWTELGSTPLIRDYDNIGQLRCRLKKPATAAFSVTLDGSGEFGASVTETLEFGVGDQELTTTDVFIDVTGFGKSAATDADAYLYDIAGTHIGTLPAKQTAVLNKRIRVMDECTAYADNGTCFRFRVLFKPAPPVWTSLQQPVEDAFGQILQSLCVAEILAKSDSTSALNRMRFHGAAGNRLINAAIKRDTEGKLIPLDLTRDPFTHEFWGHL